MRAVERWRWSACGILAIGAWKRLGRWIASRGAGTRRGTCPICAAPTRFLVQGAVEREALRCVGCGSVARQRALVLVLRSLRTLDRSLRTHEVAPSLATHRYFARRTQHTSSYLWSSVPQGERVGVFACSDMGAQPFVDGAFDVVVSQDVLEHVFEPEDALREVQRTLAGGGLHVFTVPRSAARTTRRALRREGCLHHLVPPLYHRDPLSRRGALVVTDWGQDTEQIVARAIAGGCTTQRVVDPEHGVDTEVEVFVAGRPSAGGAGQEGQPPQQPVPLASSTRRERPRAGGCGS